MKETLRANMRLLLLTGLILSNCAAALAYYHPEEGRFLSRDPIGEPGGMNLYLSMGNNAIRHIDPHGLSWSSDITGIGLLMQYFNRLIQGAYAGQLINEINDQFYLPGFLVQSWPEVKSMQDYLKGEAIKDVCAKGKGVHPVQRNGTVRFSGLSSASFNDSQLDLNGEATVSTAKECKSCLKYDAKLKLKFWDEIDAKWVTEVPGNFYTQYSSGEQALILYEAAFDIFGDTLLRANFDVKSTWETREAGCCPK